MAPAAPATALSRLRAAYASGETTPAQECARALTAIGDTAANHAFISVATPAQVAEALDRLDKLVATAGGTEGLPLHGVPLAVKDNIDVAGFATTNACPEFAYRPAESAHAVDLAVRAGAIVTGKTNLDQFATGLVGTRSPYGSADSVFGQGIISGGSSSGSALAVATGVVPVALATDTAGSGRVPAALNGIVGLKPTLGLVSTRGLLPACRSIDGITVMATSVPDAVTLLGSIVGEDPGNPWGRTPAELAPSTLRDRAPRIGLPAAGTLEFFGDDAMRAAHLAARDAAVHTLRATTAPVDLDPFIEAGALLYAGAWVAERLADLGDFLAAHADAVHPVVRDIIQGAAQYDAADAFRTQHRLKVLRHAVRPVWQAVDAVIVPTIGTTVTQPEVAAEPVAKNATLGHYTHCGNLLDLAAISIPAGSTRDGRPCSLMLLGPPRCDLTLADIAARICPPA